MKHCTILSMLLFSSFYTKAGCMEEMKALNPGSRVNAVTIQNIDTPKYATLYIYRPEERGTSLNGYNVHVADSVVCRAKNDSKYIVRLYKEGPTEIWAETEQRASIPLTVEFGKEYYLKCELYIGVFAARPKMRLVAPNRGKWEFDNTEGANSKKKNTANNND